MYFSTVRILNSLFKRSMSVKVLNTLLSGDKEVKLVDKPLVLIAPSLSADIRFLFTFLKFIWVLFLLDSGMGCLLGVYPIQSLISQSVLKGLLSLEGLLSCLFTLMRVSSSSQILLFLSFILFSRLMTQEFNLLIQPIFLAEFFFQYLSSFSSLSIIASISMDIFQLNWDDWFWILLSFMYYWCSCWFQSSSMSSRSSSFLCFKKLISLFFSFSYFYMLDLYQLNSSRTLPISQFLRVIWALIWCWYLESCCLYLPSSSSISVNYCCIMVRSWDRLSYTVFSVTYSLGRSNSSILYASLVLASLRFLHMSLSSLTLQLSIIYLRVSWGSFSQP